CSAMSVHIGVPTRFGDPAAALVRTPRVILSTMACLSCVIVRLGLVSSIVAMVPVTSGAAIDVPDFTAVPMMISKLDAVLLQLRIRAAWVVAMGADTA